MSTDDFDAWLDGGPVLDTGESTVEEWLDTPRSYAEVQPDTRALVSDVARAAAVISVRLRIDPQLREVRAERARLVKLRGELAKFAAHLLALRGYTAGQGDAALPDPGDEEARRLAAELDAASQPTSGPADNDEEQGPGIRLPE